MKVAVEQMGRMLIWKPSEIKNGESGSKRGEEGTKVLPRTPRCLTLVAVVVVTMADIRPVGNSRMSGRKPGLQRAGHVLTMLLRDILTKGQT